MQKEFFACFRDGQKKGKKGLTQWEIIATANWDKQIQGMLVTWQEIILARMVYEIWWNGKTCFIKKSKNELEPQFSHQGSRRTSLLTSLNLSNLKSKMKVWVAWLLRGLISSEM